MFFTFTISQVQMSKNAAGSQSSETKPFTLKKWNLLALWSWDVECDTCAICRVQLMGITVQSTSFVPLFWKCLDAFFFANPTTRFLFQMLA